MALVGNDLSKQHRHVSNTCEHAFDNPTLRSSRADVVRCIVLAGRRPVEEKELRCFEVFRNACKDVEVITFDELLVKLEYLQQHLQPTLDDVPF